ncbi:hypothetical protein I7I50_07173 [Histoplasma capsulatum G186AR]|uniref:Uncharacterized protein n=1 Tax=Ajellomyces capsulatus TaxID=5037 RepID=A0A8H7YVV5_AJECA|nr:hypothetical protein I7I52_09755 [Histoplasma capsulatum]QSS67940.1 hypothetical protein I7I50_07173 [Histoplasma capsulatum G186AR]
MIQPREKGGTAFYQSTNRGIEINIYNPFNGYEILVQPCAMMAETGDYQGSIPNQPFAPIYTLQLPILSRQRSHQSCQ